MNTTDNPIPRKNNPTEEGARASAKGGLMPRPNYRAQIIDAMKSHGPMTAAETSERVDIELHKVNTAISSARYQSPGQIFRIVRYQPVIGRRQRDACVFAAQPGDDVPRQPFTKRKEAKRRAQAKARYYARNSATISARDRVRKAGGRAVVVNPWLQLASPGARPAMARIAAAS